MGRVKELWQDEQDRICEEYATGHMTYQEAMYQLMRLGLDPHDAADHLSLARENHVGS